MKHSIFTYSILAAVIFAVPCLNFQAQDAAAAKTEEVKKLTPEEERKKAADDYRDANNEITKIINEFNGKRTPFIDRIAEMKKLINTPEFADTRLQLRLYEQIIRYCQQPPWTHIGVYNYETQHEELVPAANYIINSDKFSNIQKFFAFESLTRYYCDFEKFKEAESTARKAMALENLNINDKARAYGFLIMALRYQDKYGDAMKVAREIMQFNPAGGAQRAAALAIAFDKEKDADAVLKELKDPYEFLNFYRNRDYIAANRERLMPDAIAYVKDTADDSGKRLSIAEDYLYESFGSKEKSDARLTLKGVPAEKKVGTGAQAKLRRAFQLGDYPLTVELCEIYEGSKVMEPVDMRKIYLLALSAVGRTADAIKLADACAAEAEVTPVDQTRFKFYSAILGGKSTDGILKAAKLSRKEEAEVLLSAARNCLSIWNKSDLAEKYTAEYEKYFAEKPERVIDVKYFDTPVSSISEWRKIYPQLEKQYCDIPFRGSMDFLETDVATGERSVNIDKNAAQVKTMELTTACDQYGVHIFLRAEADNARSIEHGFANGIGTEMYFAPGVNQPYVCIGSNAANGVTFVFYTTYDNKNNQRPDKNNPRTSFKSEVEFTDKDYVLHLFFAWDDYYNKLPSKGTDWRFDCLAWTPNGGFSWGGSQGIHSASAWGSLRFNLTDKQLNAIRKEILFRTYRSYKMVPRDPGIRENLFECWADEEIGDPGFYAQYLAPMQKELDSYAAQVKEDMSDKDIAVIYTKALPRWKGLSHEVDELRRKYLSERLVLQGK